MTKKMTVKRLNQIESGEVAMTVEELINIAGALDVNPYTLLCPGDVDHDDLLLLDDFMKILTRKEKGLFFGSIKVLIQEEAKGVAA